MNCGFPEIMQSGGLKIDGEWQPPEKTSSALAGEPSIDNSGNVYFTHHFLVNGTISSADIYVAYRKK